MKVIEAMKLTTDEAGNIIIPVGATRGETDIPGSVTVATVQEKFGAQVDLEMPITQEQFDALVATVPGQWADNWQWYRDNGVITVSEV